MNNSSDLYVSKNRDLKKKVESILSVKENKLRCLEDMSDEEVGYLLDESLDSLKHDRLYSSKEVEEELTRELGL